jgi:hypothetical protein
MSRSRTEDPGFRRVHQVYIWCTHEQTSKLFESEESATEAFQLDGDWKIKETCKYGSSSWALIESDEPIADAAIEALVERVRTIDEAFTAIKKATA